MRLITELAHDGHIDLTDGRVRLTGTVPTNPLLAQTLENLRAHEGKKLKNRLSAVKHSGWPEVVDAMVDAGVIGREKDALRPTRHPVADPDAHAALLAEVRAAAAGNGPLRGRDAVLLALAGPCQMLEGGRPRPRRSQAGPAPHRRRQRAGRGRRRRQARDRRGGRRHDGGGRATSAAVYAG